MESLDNLVFLDFSFWARIVATIVCGSVIGWERIHSHKPVGVRTSTLICMGAAVFVMSQELILKQAAVQIDYTRIVAQIVTGVGFLGAGAIIHQGVSVKGLTSAATIWALAAIGVVIGIGYPLTGLVLTFCVWFVLEPWRKFERWVSKIEKPDDNSGPVDH
ncbi:MAG TPA: MgtC/SapB family protein [bacterium]|nr:MgtC/SapB family protein [bacterium]